MPTRRQRREWKASLERGRSNLEETSSPHTDESDVSSERRKVSLMEGVHESRRVESRSVEETVQQSWDVYM